MSVWKQYIYLRKFFLHSNILIFISNATHIKIQYILCFITVLHVMIKQNNLLVSCLHYRLFVLVINYWYVLKPARYFWKYMYVYKIITKYTKKI